MTEIDTSREAVEGFAVCLAARGYEAEAATLRALLAERDALQLALDRARAQKGCLRRDGAPWCADAVAMAAERDEARDALAAVEHERDAAARALAARIDATREEVAAAFRAGAEAMREMAAGYCEKRKTPRWGSPSEHAAAIRALPLPEPEDKA